MIEIKKLTKSEEKVYEKFVLENDTSMLYHTLNYRNFLKSFLPHAEDNYICAYDNGDLVAAIPIFIQKTEFGSLLNSLPFFGSHGGLLKVKNLSDTALKMLVQSLENLMLSTCSHSFTVIEPLFEKDKRFYELFSADLFDERIGQVTFLPTQCEKDKLELNLMQSFHPKTRNGIRKALKEGLKVEHAQNQESINKLMEMHFLNMRTIGGKSKPENMFFEINNNFKYDEDYRVYSAKYNDKVISSLLVFYHKETVEYFIPTTLPEFRVMQPMSLIIFNAMVDAISEKGSRTWNWGGTWKSQNAVYRFKSRWNTFETTYRYHVKVRNETNLDLAPEEIVNRFPYFYYMPFESSR
jgi:hypothetical protein